jgi:acyl-CoA hydrolase
MESTREGTRRFKDAEERRAQRAKHDSRMWTLVKAAVRLVDSASMMSRGVYEISPAVMIALKHHCDGMRFDLKMQELELQNGGDSE